MAKQDAEQQQQDVIVRPTKGTAEVPHEDTLGALAGAPADVAEEYSKTGKTPDGDWRQAQTAENLDDLKSHNVRARRTRGE